MKNLSRTPTELLKATQAILGEPTAPVATPNQKLTVAFGALPPEGSRFQPGDVASHVTQPASLQNDRNAALDEAALLCTMDAQTIRLHAGELNGREILAVKAVLAFVGQKICELKS